MLSRQSCLRYALFCALLCLGQFAQAQVKGLSYTISPTANYTWFDNESGLNDGFLYGGRIGLGFGEFIELRGVYMRDLSSETLFDDLGFDPDTDVSVFNDEDVDLQQYGGEMKLNLGKGKFLPFLTLGTGVQRISIDGNEASEQVYASGGLGIVFSVADRLTFTLEGKNTAYNDSPFRTLTTMDDRDVAGIDLEEFSPGDLNNLSLGLGLQLYLGGRRPGELSSVDEDYRRAFNRDFSGSSILIEPTLSRINFDDALPYRDTYLGGASLGIDFGPLVGFRAYYLKAMEDDEINLDFDDLAVWGADFRFRLTQNRSALSPFLTLGGGYIDTQDEYVGRNDADVASSQAFATGGGGIVLRISRNFSITGTYKALLTSGNDVEDINSPNEIRTSNQWSAGINLAFGKKTRQPDAIYTYEAERRLRQQEAESEAKMAAALATQTRENQRATQQLREDYELQIDDLEAQLASARRMNDPEKVDSLETRLAEKQNVVVELRDREDELAGVVAEAMMDSIRSEGQAQAIATETPPANLAANNSRTAPAAAPNYSTGATYNVNGNRTTGGSTGQIVLSPAEFENLIEEIFEGLNGPMPPPYGAPTEYDTYYEAPPRTNERDGKQRQAIRAEMDELRSRVDSIARQQQATEDARRADKEELREEMQRSTEEILREIRQMRGELNEKANMTDRQKRRLEKRSGGQ